ncbi:hypothetical protein RRG12_41665, partial [Nostoc sp. CALU 546]
EALVEYESAGGNWGQVAQWRQAFPLHQCPMPHAPYPTPNAQVPIFKLCLLTSLLSGQSLRRSVRSSSF